MFRTFSSEQLLDLVAMMSKNEVKAGTELIVQGDLGSKFYVVHFGGFDVLVQKAASEPARRVAHFGPASWFGEPALLYAAQLWRNSTQFCAQFYDPPSVRSGTDRSAAPPSRLRRTQWCGRSTASSTSGC